MDFELMLKWANQVVDERVDALRKTGKEIPSLAERLYREIFTAGFMEAIRTLLLHDMLKGEPK